MAMTRGAVKLGRADSAAQYAAAVAEVARRMAGTTPAPRGMPFFGLDMRVHEPFMLDQFCRQGIFRKYERVLILNAGLGGAARWWATHFGCTVIGVSAEVASMRGAELLSRRAGLSGPTTFVVASPTRVSLRPECVTHVWIRDVAPHADVDAMLQQAFAALRPGGHVSADTAAAATVEVLHRAAQRIGFIDVATQPVPTVAPPHAFLTALRHLESLAATLDGAALVARTASARRAAEQPGARLQLFGQRPS